MTTEDRPASYWSRNKVRRKKIAIGFSDGEFDIVKAIAIRDGASFAAAARYLMFTYDQPKG